MPLATIANLESNLSVRTKLNHMVRATDITPELHGAVGNGVTNDQAAFNSAISDAVSSGRRLRGDPGKIYYIAASLNDFTGTLRIADCTFKAPNQVRILRGNPTWTAENSSISSLTTTTIEGTTVTRVALSSTTGLAVGDWVTVGSSTVLWPGETNTRWFEAAQIVAMTTDTSIDLHRRLLGEESGALDADLRLFKIPNYRLEARNIRLIADGNVLQSGQSGRQFGIELRGGIGHRIEYCHADSWWERFIRLRSAIKSQIIGPSWHLLPDMPTANEAFGYGVHETGACYGTLMFGTHGGRCRHGYSSGGVNVAVYSSTTPWEYGFVSLATVKGGDVTGASGTAFDTHAGTYGVTFDTLTAQDPVNQAGGLTLPGGFQNRGYRTRVLNCTAHGGDVGFRDGSAITDWGADLAPNITEYSNLRVRETDQDGLMLEGANGVANTLVIVDGLRVTNGVHGVRIDAAQPFQGATHISDLRMAECTGNALFDQSGDADIQIMGFTGRYTGQAAATAPIRVDVVGGGSWLFDNLQILRRTDSSPDGLINIQDDSEPAAQLPVTLGQVAWDLGDGVSLPDLSPSSVEGTSLDVTEMNFRV